MAYDEITYADKVENNGATPAGRFGADDLNEIKTVTNANGADFDGRIDLLEAGGGGVNNLTSSGHVGDGTTVTFPLSFAPTTEVPQAFVVGIDGVLQSPIDAYTVSTTTDAITFSSAPPVNAEIVVSTANVLTGTDISASTIIATGSTTTRLLADRFADTVNVKDFGAVGDGVADDTSAVVSAEATGLMYIVPSGVIVKTTVEPTWEKVIGGGIINFNGQSTSLLAMEFNARTLLLNLASQGCTTDFARAVNLGSIYCHATGNTTSNLSSRLCTSSHEEAVNIASEECEAYGEARDVNVGCRESFAHGNCAVNLASRRAFNNGDESAIISSDTSQTGNGYGLKTEVVVSGGVVSSVNIIDGGAGFYKAPSVYIIDKSGNGSGATATATITGDAVTGISVTNGGSGFTVDDPLQVLIKMNDTDGSNSSVISSENVVIKGTRSVAISSNLVDIDGDRCVVSSSENCDASGAINSVASSSGSFVSASARSFILCSKNAELKDSHVIGGGYGESGITKADSNQNITWKINSQTGKAEFQLIKNGLITWHTGVGAPEGVILAVVGSMYTRTDGGAGTTLYIKESGTSNTGWVAK